jgi:hypothetical protein
MLLCSVLRIACWVLVGFNEPVVLLAPGSRAPAPDNRQLATPDAKEQVASIK